MLDFILRPIRRNFGEDKMFYCAIDDMFGFLPHNIELYKLQTFCFLRMMCL